MEGVAPIVGRVRKKMFFFLIFFMPLHREIILRRFPNNLDLSLNMRVTRTWVSFPLRLKLQR
jgi:hypothetical protein